MTGAVTGTRKVAVAEEVPRRMAAVKVGRETKVDLLQEPAARRIQVAGAVKGETPVLLMTQAPEREVREVTRELEATPRGTATEGVRLPM